MGLSASPLSYSSNTLSLPGTSGLGASSLSRQGTSNAIGMDQHELQQLQVQPTAVANSQYPQESQHVVQQQQQLERHPRGRQELATSQQLQGQQMLGGGLSQLRSQQVFGLGTQQQLQSMQGMSSMKLEQQVQPMHSLASVKLEQQTAPSLRHQLQPFQGGLTSVKLEQQLDSPLRQQLQQQQVKALQGLPPMKHEQSLHQQLSMPKMEVRPEAEMQVQQSLLTPHLQMQEALQLHRQQSQQFQAQMNLLQQQRILHQHRAQLQQHQQLQQHLQQQMAGPSKQVVIEQGICSRRLMQYMFNQRQRPQDNNITFWRKFVGEYFAPCAKKRWCVSQYGSSGRQPTGVFTQDVWHCEICGSRPGRGFEATVEVLPRLCKIKYDSGILDELLYVDISNEYRLSSGLMVLEYGKAIQESIFDQLRVVRDGQLRITFSPDLKILSWEFCARSHEELLPRRLLVPQVTQLAAIAQKYQNSVNQNQNGASGLSMQDLQTNCQMFVGTARQLARTLEAPTVNDLGYTKRYVRCLQISEVVNSMKDLIDFSRENGTGPMASLINFPRRTASLGGIPSQALQQQEQLGQALPSAQSVGQAIDARSSISNNSLNGMNNVLHNVSSMGSFPTLLQQNSLTSLQNTVQNNISSSIATAVDSSSTGSGSNSLQSSQGINSLQSYHPSVAGQQSSLSTLPSSVQQNSLSCAVNMLQQTNCQPTQGNQHESSNAVHHFLQEMMMPGHFKGGASFQQALAGGGDVGGSMGLNGGMAGGVGNLINNANGSGLSGNGTRVLGSSTAVLGNANGNGSSGNLAGINNCFSNGEVSLNPLSGIGSRMRNSGSNVLLNNMGAMNALGSRLDLSGGDQEQNLGIQDPSQSLLHELGGNDILSDLSNSSFNNLPFSWKSP